MAKYVKILNNKNSACAYCRVFTQDDVDTIVSAATVIFKDSADVNLARDFASYYQMTGGADLPKTQAEAIYWAPEPVALMEREWWGTIWLNHYSTGEDGTKYYDAKTGIYASEGFGTEEEATELLYGTTTPVYAFLVGGSGRNNAKPDCLYLLKYNPKNGEFTTWSTDTYLFWHVSDYENYLYNENPNYTATITGLTLNATEVSLARGEGFLFFAQVTGTGNFDPAVHYLMMGADADGGTTHDPATGLITIGMNETSPTITMLCEVVADPSFNETITITVTDPLPRPDPVEVAYRRESFFAGFAAGLALYSKKYKP